MSGRVCLIGCGPGAPDLLTIRAARAIAASDIVIWGRPFGDERLVREHARPGAEVIIWPPATMADIEAAYERAQSERLAVARLHGGDPSIYGRLDEELRRVRARGLEVEVLPGVTAACAAAAALGWELASEAERRPLVIASAQAPDGKLAPELMRLLPGGDALAVYMAGAVGAQLERALLENGYPPDTRCAIASRVSWPDEVIACCELAGLASHAAELGAERNLVVLVNRAFD
jgi:precorrin-4/cobalt-precorrin-4 C11-methyltransferase